MSDLPLFDSPSVRPRVTISSDGACLGNPGPGGFGIVLRASGNVTELSGGYRLTTNNRMEMLGAIVGLETLSEPADVLLRSDSRYLIDAMSKRWIAGWQRKGWRTSSGDPVKNQDLWQRLLVAVRPHYVKWLHVKGHAGDPDNERCDAIANAAAKGGDLLDDAVYLIERAGRR